MWKLESPKKLKCCVGERKKANSRKKKKKEERKVDLVDIRRNLEPPDF